MPRAARKHAADQSGSHEAAILAAFDAMPDSADPALSLIPLTHLYIHELNTRGEPPDMEIETLAESIAANGLMQNLAGFRDPDQPLPHTVGIVAGGRRLRALWHLERQGLWTGPVPVRVTTSEATAAEWAGAENAARQDPHPADEVRAYRDLRARGHSPAQIARAFARSLRGVQQRLKLADLPEPVLEAFRAGTLTLDQATALTLAEGAVGAEVTEAVLAAPGRWHPDGIRRRLTPDTISGADRRALYVGLEAYTAAGGRVTADLFADQTYLHDAGVLDRLFAEKAAAETEALRVAQGWSWAEFAPREPWKLVDGWTRLRAAEQMLPEGDSARYDELAEQGDALDEGAAAELAALEARMQGVWSDDQLSTGGIVTQVTHEGALEIYGAYTRSQPAAHGADAADGGVTRKVKPAAAPPENLRNDLSAIRLLSQQQAIRADRGLLLDLLAWQLTGSLHGWATPFALSATPPPPRPNGPRGWRSRQGWPTATATPRSTQPPRASPPSARRIRRRATRRWPPALPASGAAPPCRWPRRWPPATRPPSARSGRPPPQATSPACPPPHLTRSGPTSCPPTSAPTPPSAP